MQLSYMCFIHSTVYKRAKMKYPSLLLGSLGLVFREVLHHAPHLSFLVTVLFVDILCKVALDFSFRA
jgi:hypothetical protein